ncbi:MAG: hypothetical protein GC155_17865 [Alphaproteobacteria bacterium]|nr:hypothetical protein [Alphaproteobacteria bacterium]
MAGRRIGRVRQAAGLAVWLAGALTCAAPAFADNAGRPMTFEWGKVFGDTPAIFADGDFTPETPDALRAFLARSAYTPDTRIYLNSLGGDLTAGMEVGRIIRETHLNTGVARNRRDPAQPGLVDIYATSQVYPGYCISACTLAFLGGVARHVEVGATYAVHQVAMNCVDKRKAREQYPYVVLPTVTYCPDLPQALSMVQAASGAVVEYVRSMGADPIFLTEMSKADPSKLNPLSEEQLNAYRINFTLHSDSWSYETDKNGQFFLRHSQGDEWKEDRVEFFCDRTRGPRLFMWIVHDTRRSTGRADPHHIVDLASHGLTVYWQVDQPLPDGSPDIRSLALEPYEVIDPPTVTEYDNVKVTVDVSQRFLDVLASAKTFQIVTTEPEDDSKLGFNLIELNLDRDKISGIERSCK